jgi:hypothetical protein
MPPKKEKTGAAKRAAQRGEENARKKAAAARVARHTGCFRWIASDRAFARTPMMTLSVAIDAVSQRFRTANEH